MSEEIENSENGETKENSGEEPLDETNAEPADETKAEPKVPSLLHNYVSLAGITVAVASLVSIVLLFMLELSAASDQPYLGILIYILLPAVMIFGLFIILVGVLIERRRRRKLSPEEIAAYPILDLNGPRRRRAFIVFLFVSFIFLFMSAFGSYRAYEFSESVTFCGETCHSVMKPEFVAYNASPHARIRCVECHVGGGAEYYVRSKFAGVRQLYAVTFNTYHRPIETPVKNMRPARDTCEKCHWSEKFYGEQLRVFNHYGYDEKNSLNQTRLLVKVGGGDPNSGKVAGIHWHMNLANDITYIAADDQRQDIPWVRMKDMNGNVVEYTTKDAQLTPEQIEQAPKRTMDCTDCHNRPAHIYLAPNTAVDRSFEAGKLDASLPFLKLKAVETLSKNYTTTDEALRTIAADIDSYYRTSYPEVYAAKPDSVGGAINELTRIYSTYFFPEMKTDWSTHPNNIGHRTTQGCFRCHDGKHFSSEGKMIRNECNICHVTIDQTFGGKTIVPPEGKFQHPVNLGDRGQWLCATCHRGNQAFRHPVNLGDISRFQCAECHQGEKFKSY